MKQISFHFQTVYLLVSLKNFISIFLSVCTKFTLLPLYFKLKQKFLFVKKVVNEKNKLSDIEKNFLKKLYSC